MQLFLLGYCYKHVKKGIFRYEFCLTQWLQNLNTIFHFKDLGDMLQITTWNFTIGCKHRKVLNKLFSESHRLMAVDARVLVLACRSTLFPTKTTTALCRWSQTAFLDGWKKIIYPFISHSLLANLTTFDKRWEKI